MNMRRSLYPNRTHVLVKFVKIRNYYISKIFLKFDCVTLKSDYSAITLEINNKNITLKAILKLKE